MKKIVSLLFFLLLAVPVGVFAQSGIPTSSFWYEPKPFTAGDTVTFTVLVYNAEPNEAAFTVSLLDGKKKLEEQVVILASNTAVPVRFSWKATDGPHTFAAAITTVRSNGKSVALPQDTKTATLRVGGSAAASDGTIDDIQKTVKSKAGNILAKIDSWRVKKLADFEEKKTGLKSQIDSTDAEERLNSITDPEPDEAIVTAKPFLPNVSPLVYLQYVLYTALFFIFSSAFFFYLAAGFAAFIVLKFLYARFV